MLQPPNPCLLTAPSTAADIATSPVTSRAARLTTPEAAETTVGTPPSTYPPGKVLRVVGVHVSAL